MHLHNLAKLMGRPAELESIPLTVRYPRDMLIRETIKGGVGLAACLGILLYLDPSPWVAWPLGALALLFALYLTQQLRRFRLRLELNEMGVVHWRGQRPRHLRWGELENFRLNYYPNGRKASTGTLVVILQAGDGRVKVDSGLDHFPTLLCRAAQAARERELDLHPTTEANLNQLGL